MSTSIISSISLAQQVLLTCKQYELKHIVISPGSRNAPLTISFSNNNYFSSYSIVDERCAAFFALGIAQQTKQPTVLVCTSGSALLNYYPAIAEAFYSDIPLVIISADRPKEYIDIGDGQTIRQECVFSNHILFEANLKNSLEYNDQLFQYNKDLLEKAINNSLINQGPVHINVPFYEPLYDTVNVEQEKEVQVLKKILYKDLKYSINKDLLNKWNIAAKKMILVGVLSPNQITEITLNKLLQDPSVLLLTETTSNLHHLKAIPSIDQLIASLTNKEKEQLQPELLITFGGLIISKKIKAFLRNFQPANHWHIDNKKANNTFQCLTNHIKTTPQLFLESLLFKNIEKESNYQQHWLSQYKDRLKGHCSYVKEIPYCDLSVYAAIAAQLPSQLHLQLSNSSTIRYMQLFQYSKGVEQFCNRGTSGIDGSTSTAIGAGVVHQKPSLLITGDLSFFYDSNALWNNYIPSTFKIIIVNNSGGGIFRILPGNKQATYFETYLETTHNLKAKSLATMYGFDYLCTEEDNELEENLKMLFVSKKKMILEINTPRTINDTILLNYFKKIRKI